MRCGVVAAPAAAHLVARLAGANRRRRFSVLDLPVLDLAVCLGVRLVLTVRALAGATALVVRQRGLVVDDVVGAAFVGGRRSTASSGETAGDGSTAVESSIR